MAPVIIHASRRKLALLLLGAVVFVVLGFWIIDAKPDKAWAGWLSIVFCGLGIPVFLWQILDRRPRIVIDEQGITDRTLGVGTIAWADIENAERASITIRGQEMEYIGLHLRNTETYLQKASPGRRPALESGRMFSLAPFSLSLHGTDANRVELLRLILDRIGKAHVVVR